MNEQKGFLVELAELMDRHLRSRGERTTGASWWDRVLSWFLPNGGTLLIVALLILTTNVWASPLLNTADTPGPSATTVNYQGRLADSSGNPEDGTFGMSFSLWDAASGGSLVWGPESYTAVPVSGGLFSVGLGGQTAGGIPTSAWNGDRYLEIAVGGETLEPRELIRSVPVAGMALTVPDGSITTEKFSDGLNLVSLHLFDNPPLILEGDVEEPNGVWSLLDLSAWVPADTQAVILNIVVDTDREDDQEFRIGFRKPGSAAANWHVLSVDGHYRES